VVETELQIVKPGHYCHRPGNGVKGGMPLTCLGIDQLSPADFVIDLQNGSGDGCRLPRVDDDALPARGTELDLVDTRGSVISARTFERLSTRWPVSALKTSFCPPAAVVRSLPGFGFAGRVTTVFLQALRTDLSDSGSSGPIGASK
jgi:hypothetical protein